MDYTVLYMFLAIGVTFGITYLVSYLRRNNKLSQEDLILVRDMLGIGVKVISELRLDKETELVNLSNVIIDSLEYAISFFNTEQDVINNAYSFSLELCDVHGIELTESRKDLLLQLITIVFNDNYIQFIEY